MFKMKQWVGLIRRTQAIGDPSNRPPIRWRRLCGKRGPKLLCFHSNNITPKERIIQGLNEWMDTQLSNEEGIPL